MTTSFLTAERVRGYSSMIIVVNAAILALTFITPADKPTIFGDGFSGDFPAFYGAGRIINERGNLYDLQLQDRIFHELQPSQAPDTLLPFVYTPFFALLFAPLALLPLKWAFALWLITSTTLFVSGFHFLWRSCEYLPSSFKRTALIASLAFIPFSVLTLGGGQVVAFGFFFLCLAIYLEKQRPLLAGVALSFVLFKPTLLLLILPMLLISRRFRVATGFLIGALGLGLLSLWVIGVGGVNDYLHALRLFRSLSSSTIQYFPTWRYVDLSAFFRVLTGKSLPAVHYTLAFLAFSVLAVRWFKAPRTAWASAITFTLLLNIYSPMYDTTYLIIGVLLTANEAYRKGLNPTTLNRVICVLFILPIFTTLLAHKTGIQLMTLAILGLGIYQARFGFLNRQPIMTANERPVPVGVVDQSAKGAATIRTV